MPIVNRIADLHDEIKAWRRDLHAHPELLYDVHRTAASVAEKLKAFGCDEVVSGLGRTGVVGVIRGGKGRDVQKVIGLRADMDALPIDEANDFSYRSTVPGKMHACGHDGHTAMLLGAARYLAETRNFGGTAIVIFQPAEEGGGGGREMVRDGLMDRFGIEEVYGMHNFPGLPVGQFAIRSGPVMAAADRIAIEIEGVGGHAARPNLAIDPILVGGQTAFAASVAAEVAGADRVNTDAAPLMGAEDFSYMLEARPGAFIFVGNGDSAGLHNPAYDFNDEAIPVGSSYWARLVETALPG